MIHNAFSPHYVPEIKLKATPRECPISGQPVYPIGLPLAQLELV